MGWTLPRVWSVGEIITKAIMDLHIKDNLRYLKGQDGVPTIQSGLIIDNSLGTEYLQIPSLTTTERNALTPIAGMVIYNETTTQFNKYENAAWRADLGYNSAHSTLSGLTAGDDHTQYLKEADLTTKGDIYVATGAGAVTRLGVGANNQVVTADSAQASGIKWAATTFLGFASGQLMQSNDTERVVVATSYTKIKEILINTIGFTTIRISFEMKTAVEGGYTHYGRIYLNGAAVGTERTQTSETYVTFTEDLNAATWAATNLIQIYVKAASGGVRVQNLRLYYGFKNDFTNQDPV